MKNLILGAVKGVSDINYIYNWIQSAKQVSNSDVVLISYEDLSSYKETDLFKGVFIVDAQTTAFGQPSNAIHTHTGYSNRTNSHDLVHHLRFFHYWQLLSTLIGKYNNVVITDVKDVIFNKKISNILDLKLDNIFVADECIQFEYEPWNKDNILKNFGPYIYEQLKDKSVGCCGVILGSVKDIMELSMLIYQIASGKFVADQSGLNVIKYLNSFYNEKIIYTSEFLQCHTRMKSECEPFSTNFYKFNEEDIDDFAIIHQYERIPELLDYINMKFQGNK